MKNLVIILLIPFSFILFGCKDDKVNHEQKSGNDDPVVNKLDCDEVYKAIQVHAYVLKHKKVIDAIEHDVERQIASAGLLMSVVRNLYEIDVQDFRSDFSSFVNVYSFFFNEYGHVYSQVAHPDRDKCK